MVCYYICVQRTDKLRIIRVINNIHSFILSRQLPERTVIQRHWIRMKRKAPINIAINLYIGSKQVKELARCKLPSCAIFIIPALIDADKYPCTSILALYCIVTNTKLSCIMGCKHFCGNISHIMPRFAGIYFITDNPSMDCTHCTRIAICQKR